MLIMRSTAGATAHQRCLGLAAARVGLAHGGSVVWCCQRALIGGPQNAGSEGLAGKGDPVTEAIQAQLFPGSAAHCAAAPLGTWIDGNVFERMVLDHFRTCG